MPTFKYEFPLFHNKLDFSVISKKDYNWKGILKEQANYRARLICLITLLTEKKKPRINISNKMNKKSPGRIQDNIRYIKRKKKKYFLDVEELLSSNLRIK